MRSAFTFYVFPNVLLGPTISSTAACTARQHAQAAAQHACTHIKKAALQCSSTRQHKQQHIGAAQASALQCSTHTVSIQSHYFVMLQTTVGEACPPMCYLQNQHNTHICRGEWGGGYGMIMLSECASPPQ